MIPQERRDDVQTEKEQTPHPQTGDPGRTPGAAEGDAETIEQDLRDKGLDDEKNR